MRELWKQRQPGQRAWPPKLLMSLLEPKEPTKFCRFRPLSEEALAVVEASEGLGYMQFQKPTGTGM
jgi:hypothetical protein